MARSANVGPFNTAVGGPQRACKLPLEVLHPRAFPSKGAPEGRSGGGLAQGCNLNLERPRTCGRRPFGAGVGETGTRESHLGGPLGSSNGRIEWSSVGRPGQRWQTGPLINQSKSVQNVQNEHFRTRKSRRVFEPGHFGAHFLGWKSSTKIQILTPHFGRLPVMFALSTSSTTP